MALPYLLIRSKNPKSSVPQSNRIESNQQTKMKSHQHCFGSGKDGNINSASSSPQPTRGHQRHRSLGKAMPVTSLLLNFPPLHRSAYYTRDERMPDHELSPILFSLNDADVDSDGDATMQQPHPPSASIKTDMNKLKFKKNNDDDAYDDGGDDVEREFEILVSECSGNSSNGEDNANGDDRHITLVGNSKFYTPCLTCTNNAPADLANRSSAINDMCRRLCSDECRLRLSLAGFVPPTEAALASATALTDHIKQTLGGSVVSSSIKSTKSASSATKPPVPLTRPPPPIAIERKKFLMELLTPTDSDSDSNFVDEHIRDKNKNKNKKNEGEGEGDGDSTAELQQVVNAVVDLNPDYFCDDDVRPQGSAASNVIDQHEIGLLKDFRERIDVAEALAKTSAMTSTSKIKQRLAARKLEIELEAQANEKLANDSESGNASSIASTATATATAMATATAALAASIVAASIAEPNSQLTGAAGCGATQPSLMRSDNVPVKTVGNDFEPPRDLLLYLVRMGSFNSAPKINNIDSQDDGLEIPQGLNASELLHHVKILRGEQYPPLLSRFFLKPMALATPSALATELASNDITDGLRYLQLNTVSRVCSTPLKAAPHHIRLLQWNILSQTLGQNNDGFVRCPEEALTWENRKFLIVQEILQHNPDIVCLQEVDHFKFLQTILGTQNYEGIFFPKPDSPCLYIEENNGPDGCAIFFKRDKFELKEFETRILEVWRVQSNQVAIAANLYAKAIDKEICVCTTHLKARQGSLLSKLRNEQGRDLLRFVRNFAGENRPVIVCGDFNAEPIEPVYATMLSSEKLKFSSAYADMKMENSIENCIEKRRDNSEDDEVNNVDEGVPDDGNVYEVNSQKSLQNEPPYTTWKIREDGEECHTIDYVFYTKDQFKVLNCLEFPPEDEIGKNRTPSFQYPSDHFSLVCDFEILPKPQRNEDTNSKMKAQ